MARLHYYLSAYDLPYRDNQRGLPQWILAHRERCAAMDNPPKRKYRKSKSVAGAKRERSKAHNYRGARCGICGKEVTGNNDRCFSHRFAKGE